MLNLVQGSPEWLQARAGSLGASQIADALARTKSGWGAGRANIRAQLIRERLTGRPTETFCSAAMQRGKDLEPQARAMYAFQTGYEVEEIGLLPHPKIAGSHCSPDGLCDAGLVEIKCCGDARHHEILDGDEPEDRYVKQCLWQMACTGAEWADLAYFNPEWPAEMQLVIRRIDRDAAAISELEDQVRAFLAEVDKAVADLRVRYLEREAA
jgi:putative phage-type endonuclease